MPIEDRRAFKDMVSRAVRSGHPGWDPSEPPPPMQPGTASLIKALAKRLGPWVALGTALTTAGGWLIGFGRKTAELATKEDLNQASAADVAVHKAQSSQLEAIREHLS